MKNTTAPKPFVFVLMPFDPEFDDVYKLGIKPACDEAGAYAERVDEQIYKESMLARIYNQIAKADIIVADMSGRNPNVFYEVGYAHALGKHVVLLTQKSEDIPFDLKHYAHIIYEGRIADLIPELKKRFEWFIDHPQKSSYIFPVQVYFEGTLLQKNKKIIVEQHKLPTTQAQFKLDLHNPITSEVNNALFQVGFVTSKRIDTIDEINEEGLWLSFKKFKQPDNKLFFIRNETREILPGAWDNIYLSLRTRVTKNFSENCTEEVIIRIISETGTLDFPFSIEFKMTKFI